MKFKEVQDYRQKLRREISFNCYWNIQYMLQRAYFKQKQNLFVLKVNKFHKFQNPSKTPFRQSIFKIGSCSEIYQQSPKVLEKHLWRNSRSSRSQIFFKIGVLKNFGLATILKRDSFTEHFRWLLLKLTFCCVSMSKIFEIYKYRKSFFSLA